MFWSGRINGSSIVDTAVKCAIANNAATIGMVMCQTGGFTMPQAFSPEGNQLWAYASKIFAKYTSGTAICPRRRSHRDQHLVPRRVSYSQQQSSCQIRYRAESRNLRTECYWRCDAGNARCVSQPQADNKPSDFLTCIQDLNHVFLR